VSGNLTSLRMSALSSLFFFLSTAFFFFYPHFTFDPLHRRPRLARNLTVRPKHLSDQNFDHDYYFKLPLRGAGCPIIWTTFYFTPCEITSFPAFEPNSTNCE